MGATDGRGHDFGGDVKVPDRGTTACSELGHELRNIIEFREGLSVETESARDASEVASVAKAYRVYFRKNGDSNGEYTVDHSAFVYLMDGQGNYLTHFPFDTTSDIMTSVIKKHIVGDKGA